MKKEMYMAPEVEILNVMVEQGFEASGSFDFGEGEGGGILPED